MRQFFAVPLTAILLAAPIAGAHADAMQKPGKWDEAISIKMTGLPAKDQDDLKKGGMGAFLTGDVDHNDDCVKPPGKTLNAVAQQATEGMFDASCALSLTGSGNTLTGDMVCPAVKGKGHGVYTVTDDTLTMKFTMDQIKSGTPVHTDMSVESKFVKDSCK
jgi:Protein of unknown function (DUF3617)